jgi:polysaccharide biosynthesis transport protein
MVSDAVFKPIRWMSPAMLPLGAVLGFVVAGLITYVAPKIYESEAVIEVRKSAGDTMVQSSVLERIKSRVTLERVVDQLELANKWNLDKDGAVVVLKKIVTYQGIHGTDLVAVEVRHTDRMEVVRIASAVVGNFKDQLEHMEREKSRKALDELGNTITGLRVDLENEREIFAKEVRLWYSGQENRDACVHAKNTWYETLEQLSKLDSERFEMEFRQSINDDPVAIHQNPEIPVSPVSPKVLLNLTSGALGGFLIGGLLGMILRPRVDSCV